MGLVKNRQKDIFAPHAGRVHLIRVTVVFKACRSPALRLL